MGPVTEAVRRELEDLDAANSALGTLALNLAEHLDDGAGMATAAVSKELRATLDALRPKENGAGDAFSAFLDQLRDA